VSHNIFYKNERYQKSLLISSLLIKLFPMLVERIDHFDTQELFNRFAHRNYAFFLDSGRGYGDLGKFSFIGCDPFLVFKSKGNKLSITTTGDSASPNTSNGAPLDTLRLLLREYAVINESDFPFLGGAVGFFGYELCHQLEKLPHTTTDDRNIEDLQLGFYDGIIAIDHVKNEAYAITLGLSMPAEERMAELLAIVNEDIVLPLPSLSKQADFQPDMSQFEASLSPAEHHSAVNKIKDYIAAGDAYEVNLTLRFECALLDNPINIYNHLRQINPAPFSAFLGFDDLQVLSASPELFLKKQSQYIETRPIKGTRPRGKNEAEDLRLREELLQSEKDKAELLMIVDLARNDLGRVCEYGSVKEENVFAVSAFPSVFHLDATISGTLRPRLDIVDALKAAFPGGSITGAPKIRSMEIIDEIEPTQRDIYTGAIGYIGFDGNACLNIAIRTIICKNEKAYFHVGGAIVWDSSPEDEYQEALHKGRLLAKALQYTQQEDACLVR